MFKRENIFVLVFIFLAMFAIFRTRDSKQKIDFYRFPGLEGPTHETSLPATQPSSIKRYEQGSPSRLAILLTDQNSAWLGLAHGLKAIGVPFFITKDPDRALQSKVVLVYPLLSGKVLSSEALQSLGEFARDKGTLMAVDVLGGGLNPVFGFEKAESSRDRYRVEFQTSTPLFSSLTHPREVKIRLGGEGKDDHRIGSTAYLNPKRPPLAIYGDGKPAIVENQFENGRAVAIGWDIGFLMHKGYANREERIARSYVNGYEPTIDVLLRAIKKVYQESVPEAVTIWPVPEGKSLTAIISHDVDYTASLKNALEYAQWEKENGIPSTYFLQTKYVTDYNDSYFLNEDGARYLKTLGEMGPELASHSVSHSRTFAQFDMGNGQERYPDYTPVVKSKTKTMGGSILGELRVSSFLIESFTSFPVVSFRPGHLSNPYRLPEALEATGYRYSSSVTANNSLTHLPFQLNYSRQTFSESPIYEFPVTIEDEAIQDEKAWLRQSLDLADLLKNYGGLFMVLIHTDILGKKLAFQEKVINGIKEFSWFGTLEEFGDFWGARDHVQVDATLKGGSLTVKLEIPKKVKGLTFETPPGFKLREFSPSSTRVGQEGNRLMLGSSAGEIQLVLRK